MDHEWISSGIEMITQLRIKNFQCHKDTRIDFDPLVTCIVGPSNAGKSSIIRSLRWLSLNKPSGDVFIHHGKKRVSIRLSVDGHKITRRKGSENSYSLDGKVFKAFGMSGVPDEVSKVLNLSDVAFQRQHDPPFWFLLSPGEVSRELNKIVNLDLIDRTMGSLSSGLRRSRVTLEISQDRLRKARENRDELSWVLGAEEALKEVEAKYDKVLEILEKRSKIAQIIEEGTKIREARRRASLGLSEGQRVLLVGDRTRVLGEKVSRLCILLNEITSMENLCSSVKRNFEDATSNLQRKMKGQDCPLCGKKM